MKIYLAGGISGNLKPAWKKTANPTADSFITALKQEKFLKDENISCRRSSVEKWGGYDKTIKEYRPYILESFYYADADTERLLPYFGDFMLDSGAFTFMQNSKTAVNWNDYAERYIDFIKINDIKKYIELDLDYIIGVKEARKLREILENKTGRKSIPVWHPIRGKEEFLKMCDEYEYVALGGIVGQKWRGVEEYMPWFIKEAHKRKAKIHGLGFTKFTKLKDYHFDSVDSTAWTTGNRFGYIYHFNGSKIEKIDKPPGTMISDSRTVALHNYCEWIKFQKWADVNL